MAEFDTRVLQAEAPSPLLALARQVAREWVFVNELEVHHVEEKDGALDFVFRRGYRMPHLRLSRSAPPEDGWTRESLFAFLDEISTTPRAR